MSESESDQNATQPDSEEQEINDPLTRSEAGDRAPRQPFAENPPE